MILLAVKEAGAVPAVLAAGSGSLAGKPIIDCTNGVDPVAGLLEHGKSIAERIADAAPEAHVVKGFNLCHFKVWENGPPRYNGTRLAVPFCGDDPSAKAETARLVEAMGYRPIDIGPLMRARNLEAMAGIVIGLLFQGADPSTTFNLVDVTAR